MDGQLYSSEAAKVLGIGNSTLRKYAALLENKGYNFERGPNNGRIFHHQDLTVISDMREIVEKEGVSLEEAAETLLETVVVEKKHVPSTSDHDFAVFLAQIKELESQQSTLTEMNRNLAKQVEILTEKIEERERDKQLFQLMEESRKKKKRKGMAIFRPLTAITGRR